MATIQERIKELRTEKGYTQEELAKLLGLNAKSNIANYESGANAPSDKIKIKMCQLFNCSMDYLMGKSNFKTSTEEFERYKENSATDAILEVSEGLLNLGFNSQQILEIRKLLLSIGNKDSFKKISDIRNNLTDKQKEKFDIITNLFFEKMGHHIDFYNLKKFKENYSKFYMCPVYGQISAGQPNWVEENIEGRLPIDTDLMDIYSPEEYFFLRVNGESMNKVIKNGAFALIHKQDTVENGEIAVVLVNGYDATLKKFTKQGDLIILEPNSTDESFETQVYDKTTSIKILGKYVGKLEINK